MKLRLCSLLPLAALALLLTACYIVPTPGLPPRGTPILPISAATGCWTETEIAAGPGINDASQVIPLPGGEALTLDNGSPGEQPAPLLLRWNGTRWSEQGAPLPLEVGFGPIIAATATDDIWAVGHNIYHSDGITWQKLPSPVSDQGFTSPFSDLAAVAARARDDVWAVGGSHAQAGGPLILHWDGSAWSLNPAPNPGSQSRLVAVADERPDDAWAVGNVYSEEALVLHWDGKTWQRVSFPPVRAGLQTVAALAPDDVWVGGTYNNHHVLLFHWDGKAWKESVSGVPGEVESFLTSLATVAPDNIWALGMLGDLENHRTLVLHWDGTSWTEATGPSFSPAGHFNDIAADAAGNVWLAGGYTEADSGFRKARIAHLGPGPCPAEAFTPAPTPPAGRLFPLPGPLPTAVSLVPGANGGHYIFEFRSGNPNTLNAYALDAKQGFPIRTMPGTGYEVSSIAGDGQTVVWIENHAPDPMTIHAYDLNARRESTLLTAPGPEVRYGGVAVSGRQLFYEVSRYSQGGQPGLYSRNLDTGAESHLSDAGRRPVAADGVLLWSETRDIPLPTPTPAPEPTATPVPDAPSSCCIGPFPRDCTLHLLRLDGSAPIVSAKPECDSEGPDGFTGYALSGDHAIWTGAGLDHRAYLYTISTRTTTLLATSVAYGPGFSDPVISGNIAVWTGPSADHTSNSSLFLYRLDTAHLSRLIPNSDQTIHPEFILGDSVIYTLGGPGTASPLYIISAAGR